MQETRCDGVTRRQALKVGSLAFLGITLPDWQRLHGATAKADACIFIWLDGGPSHLDTFDLKPDAPAEVGGTFKAIPTVVPGIHICEHLPTIAKHMKKIAVVRTLTSVIGEHDLSRVIPAGNGTEKTIAHDRPPYWPASGNGWSRAAVARPPARLAL